MSHTRLYYPFPVPMPQCLPSIKWSNIKTTVTRSIFLFSQIEHWYLKSSGSGHLDDNSKRPRIILLCGRDIVLDIGTGSGKTLCFTLPLPLNNSDVALTVSPLTALMIDQWPGMLILHSSIQFKFAFQLELLGKSIQTTYHSHTPRDSIQT